MNGPALRFRYLATTQGRAVAAALLVVAAMLLIGGAWAAVNPPTRTVSEPIDRQQVTTTLGHSVVVTGANATLHEQGTRLRNEPVYLFEEAPTATLHLRTTGHNTTVRASQRVTLVYRAVHDETTFWTERHVLATETATAQTVVTNARVNVTKIRHRVDALQRELGAAGSLQVALVVNATYDTGTYTGAINRSLPLTVGANFYSLPTATATKTHHHTQRHTISLDRPDWHHELPALLGVLTIVTAAGLVVTARRETEDPETLKRLLHEVRHAEWISRGALELQHTEHDVEMTSLEGLVDVAIDNDSRVIHDPDRTMYAVLDDETAYVYHYEPSNGA